MLLVKIRIHSSAKTWYNKENEMSTEVSLVV